jgi:hypothetical protein
VEGFDLSPIQPQFIPPNLIYRVDGLDVGGWRMSGKFELIHTRRMNGFAIKNWRSFFAKALDALRPGGWVECQEIDWDFQYADNTMPDPCYLRQWQADWEAGLQSAHITGRCNPESMAEKMRAMGFININIVQRRLIIGSWHDDAEINR